MDQDQINTYIQDFLNNFRTLNFPEETIQQMGSKMKVAHVKSKATLILPGEVCKNIYYVYQGGFVCRYVHPKSGEAKTINFYLDDLHPFMACLDSYFTQTPTNCELKAITESIVLILSKKELDQLVEKDKYMAQFHHNVMSTAMMEENEVKTKLIAYSSKEKYDFILQEMPSVIQRVPSKYIAEFCGISPEWLSKLKKQH